VTEGTFRPVDILGALVNGEVKFVLIGGLAASMRGSPVITGDLDICYSKDPENLERLSSVLVGLSATLRGVDETVPFQLDAKTLAAGDAFTFTTYLGALDCLGIPAGTAGYEDLDADATSEQVGEVTIRVCSLDALERMKRASARPKDLIALEWIRAIRAETEGP
jgi:hypothetical protein